MLEGVLPVTAEVQGPGAAAVAWAAAEEATRVALVESAAGTVEKAAAAVAVAAVWVTATVAVVEGMEVAAGVGVGTAVASTVASTSRTHCM